MSDTPAAPAEIVAEPLTYQSRGTTVTWAKGQFFVIWSAESKAVETGPQGAALQAARAGLVKVWTKVEKYPNQMPEALEQELQAAITGVTNVYRASGLGEVEVQHLVANDRLAIQNAANNANFQRAQGSVPAASR